MLHRGCASTRGVELPRGCCWRWPPQHSMALALVPISGAYTPSRSISTTPSSAPPCRRSSPSNPSGACIKSIAARMYAIVPRRDGNMSHGVHGRYADPVVAAAESPSCTASIASEAVTQHAVDRIHHRQTDRQLRRDGRVLQRRQGLGLDAQIRGAVGDLRQRYTAGMRMWSDALPTGSFIRSRARRLHVGVVWPQQSTTRDENVVRVSLD